MSHAAAQRFELNRYHAPPLVRDGLGLSGAETLAHLQLDVQLVADFAHRPLLLDLATGDSYALVSEQLALQLGIALGLSQRASVFVAMPVNLLMLGDDPPAGIRTRLPRPEGAGAGDVSLGARARLLGDSGSTWQLALQGQLSFPVAQLTAEQHYSGEDGLSLDQKLLLQATVRAFRARASAGLRVRPQAHLSNVHVGDEFTFGAGIEYALARGALRLLADLVGASFIKNFGGRPHTPVEVLAGAKYLHASGFAAGLAVGPGVSPGVGTPVWRGLLSIGWTVSLTSLDVDGDGLDDDVDLCPNAAEDRDGWQDDNGCPEADNDVDDVPDPADECPDDAEDRDGVEDQDGCPDRDEPRAGVLDVGDHDRDSIADRNDACPEQPEDFDAFEDRDGCPDPDNDRDGVTDAVDRCPTQRGDIAAAGCALARYDAAAGIIRLEAPLGFIPDSEEFTPQSARVLQAIQLLVATETDIQRIRVESHIAARGSLAHNRELSKRRAWQVARWLRGAGIASERLEAVGCAIKPVSNRKTGAAATREDVALLVLDPARSAPLPRECQSSPL